MERFLDIGLAVRQVRTGAGSLLVFARPLLILNVLMWGIGVVLQLMLHKGLYLSLFLTFGAVQPLAEYSAILLISSAYLRSQSGLMRGLRESLTAYREQNAWSTVTSLYARFWIWGMISVLITMIIGFAGLIMFFIARGAHAANAAAKANVEMPHGWTWPVMMSGLVIFAFLFSRYLFALPLRAIVPDDGFNALAEGLKLARIQRGLVRGIAVSECLLISVIPSTLHHLARPRLLRHPVLDHEWELVNVLVATLVVTWFALLKTELALQSLRFAPGQSDDVVSANPDFL